MDKKRILVVDDEPDLTFLVKLTLEQTGRFDVHEVNDAAGALDAARQFAPDLVLLDVMMPDLDGGDIAALMEKDPALRGTPVVFLTAMVLKEEVGKSKGHIAGRPFLAKPVTAPALLEAIDDNL